MSEYPYKMPARQGMIVLAEARRRVTEEHGPRPSMVSMGAPRPSFNNITAGFAVTAKMLERFSLSLERITAGQAWDRLVTAECRRIAVEIANGTFELDAPHGTSENVGQCDAR